MLFCGVLEKFFAGNGNFFWRWCDFVEKPCKLFGRNGVFADLAVLQYISFGLRFSYGGQSVKEMLKALKNLEKGYFAP